MTVEEIFTKIFTHMQEGITMHCKMAQAYDFLGLRGFSACHVKHYIEEAHNYMRLTHFYSLRVHKLPQIDEFIKPTIIPDNWFKYSTDAVDTGTKRSTTKELMVKWVEWEKQTKKLYEQMYTELNNLGEICLACELQYYIKEVDKELIGAEKKQFNLETLGYDGESIITYSDKLNKKYHKIYD